MQSKKRIPHRVNLCPPHQLKVHDFAISPAQAIAGIQDTVLQLKLNRCQFKRIASMCHMLYKQTSSSRDLEKREIIGCLQEVYARSTAWKQASPVQSLALIPREMDLFEEHCIQLCGNYTVEIYVPSEDEIRGENQMIASVIQEVVSIEPFRSEAMNLQDKAAELLVSGIQMTLDNYKRSMEPRSREECIKALRKLGAKAGVLPARARIDEVTFPGSYPVAEGGYANVWKGNWNGKLVAVKRQRIFESQGKGTNSMQNSEETLLEILLWLQLSHEFVQPLYGVFTEEGPFYSMVSEWMSNGTVKDYLNKPENRAVNRPLIVCQIAQGLQYLHHHIPFVAHGDLKASNVLMDQNGRPRIADFGQSSLHYSIDRTNTCSNYLGTERYLAPEQLRQSKAPSPNVSGSRATLEGDMWSLAMLMYEIFTGTMVFPETPSQIVLLDLVEKRLLPPRPLPHITERGLSDEVWGIMCECWKYDAKDRPRIDYVVRNLERVIRDIRPTARNPRIVTVCIPAALVKRVITDDGANCKELNIKIVPFRNFVVKNGQKMAVIEITGDASEVAEAQHRILEAVQKIGEESGSSEIRVPKMLHGFIIGEKHCTIKKIEQMHKVQIRPPSKNSTIEAFGIDGTTMGIAAAKAHIEKMIRYGQSSRDVLTLPPRALEMLNERRSKVTRFLREMNIDSRAGTVTLHGISQEGLDTARSILKAIEKEASCEVVEVISVRRYLCDMIKSDPKTWMDVVERCCNSEHIISMGKYGLRDIRADSLEIRGLPEQITSVRQELREMEMIGSEGVTGKRIPTRFHESTSILGPQKELIKHLMRDCGTMVYFPTSGGYAAVGVPDNMHRYDDDAIKKNEVVKIVGSREARAKARNYFEDLLERMHYRDYDFPIQLEQVLQRKLEPHFRLLGISLNTNSKQTASQSMLSFVSDDPDDITAAEPGREPQWTIHERHDPPKAPQCRWSLNAESAEAVEKGGEFLVMMVKETFRRIGVLHLPDPKRLHALRAYLSDLQAQYDGITFEIVGNPDRVVIGGPSSDAVETVIRKILHL